MSEHFSEQFVEAGDCVERLMQLYVAAVQSPSIETSMAIKHNTRRLLICLRIMNIQSPWSVSAYNGEGPAPADDLFALHEVLSSAVRENIVSDAAPVGKGVGNGTDGGGGDTFRPGEACALLAQAIGEPDPKIRTVTAYFEKLRKQDFVRKVGQGKKIKLVDANQWREICEFIKKAKRSDNSISNDEIASRLQAASKTKQEKMVRVDDDSPKAEIIARAKLAKPAPRTFASDKARRAAEKNSV